jgi:hypothetical protein
MVTNVEAVFFTFFLKQHTDDDGGEDPVQRTIWFVRQREGGRAGRGRGEKVGGW